MVWVFLICVVSRLVHWWDGGEGHEGSICIYITHICIYIYMYIYGTLPPTTKLTYIFGTAFDLLHEIFTI